MIYILTSSPSVSMDGAINPANDFLYNLRQVVKQPSRCIFVTTYPADIPWSEHCSNCMRAAFEDVGFEFKSYTLLDDRTAHHAKQLVKESDFIILGGGHVPSQNEFLHRLHFDKLLKGYKGVVMGISAGSMNCARVVYALPEGKDEIEDPNYKRFLPGLGITEVQIVPHFYMYKDGPVDGTNVIFNLAAPDSRNGRRFYAFPDGTYLLGRNGEEKIYGEYYIIENGVMRKAGEDGQIMSLSLPVF